MNDPRPCLSAAYLLYEISVEESGRRGSFAGAYGLDDTFAVVGCVSNGKHIFNNYRLNKKELHGENKRYQSLRGVLFNEITGAGVYELVEYSEGGDSDAGLVGYVVIDPKKISSINFPR